MPITTMDTQYLDVYGKPVDSEPVDGWKRLTGTSPPTAPKPDFKSPRRRTQPDSGSDSESYERPTAPKPDIKSPRSRTQPDSDSESDSDGGPTPDSDDRRDYIDIGDVRYEFPNLEIQPQDATLVRKWEEAATKDYIAKRVERDNSGLRENPRRQAEPSITDSFCSNSIPSDGHLNNNANDTSYYVRASYEGVGVEDILDLYHDRSIPAEVPGLTADSFRVTPSTFPHSNLPGPGNGDPSDIPELQGLLRDMDVSGKQSYHAPSQAASNQRRHSRYRGGNASMASSISECIGEIREEDSYRPADLSRATDDDAITVALAQKETAWYTAVAAQSRVRGRLVDLDIEEARTKRAQYEAESAKASVKLRMAEIAQQSLAATLRAITSTSQSHASSMSDAGSSRIHSVYEDD